MTKNTQLRSLKRPSHLEHSTLYKIFPNWSLLAVDFLCCCTKMDPQYRPSAEELLKHNYFIHDRFPEKFIPALREKVRIEFNENPLLRKFKADIFMSSSEFRREEMKPKRVQPTEVPRWRINLIQGSVKRKFSSETINSEDGKNLTSFHKTGQKLSSTLKLGNISKSNSIQGIKRDENNLQSIKKDESRKEELIKKEEGASKKEELSTQITKKDENVLNKKEENIIQNITSFQSLKREDKSPIASEHKLGSLIVPKLSYESSRSSQRDNPRLEKALDLLSKLNKRNQYCRPKSTTKDLLYSNLPASPEFQSLQTHSYREISKSPAQSLHPSITNIGLSSKDKKSPHITQSVNNLTLKSVFGQVPITHPPKTQYLKKLDKYVFVETTPLSHEVSRHNSPPDWMSSVGVAQKKRDPWKKSDEFTLPTVPGGKFQIVPGSLLLTRFNGWMLCACINFYRTAFKFAKSQQ